MCGSQLSPGDTGSYPRSILKNFRYPISDHCRVLRKARLVVDPEDKLLRGLDNPNFASKIKPFIDLFTNRINL